MILDILENNLHLVMGVSMVFGLIIGWIVEGRRIAPVTDPVQMAISHIRFTAIVMGIVIIGMWFTLPDTGSLSISRYPDSVEEISRSKDVLRYLQEYNKAIVRTTEVLHWFMLLFVGWFLHDLFYVAGLLRKVRQSEADIG